MAVILNGVAAVTSSGAKMGAMWFISPPSSLFHSSVSKVRWSCKTERSNFRGVLVQRGRRCDIVASLNDEVDSDLNTDITKPSSLLALEQLKTSAADRYTKERASIVVIGLSVHTAPVELREKLSIPEAEWPRSIGELCNLNHIEEAAILSTCNRIEIYVVALSQERGVKEVTDWLSKTSGVSISNICMYRFLLYNKEAAQHLFEVSAGLDSLIVGECQILAQVKQVVRVGQGVAGFGRNVSGLFMHAISVGKRVRTETNISSGAVSISSAAVELALMKLSKASRVTARMLVVGAGKMGKLVVKHLVAKGCTRVVVLNRSEERFLSMREEMRDVEMIYKPLAELQACAAEADVIFTSTTSTAPLFLKEHVKDFPPVDDEAGGARLFIDISIPRNVGSCVNDLKNVHVYNVDDLKEVVAANKEERLREVVEARAIIANELDKFVAWRDSLETVPTIKKLRAYAEKIRAAELEKCMSKMGNSVPGKALQAVDDLSHNIVKKLLHGPMQHLRCDGSRNRTLTVTLENMHALNRMFNLDTEIAILEQKLHAKQKPESELES